MSERTRHEMVDITVVGGGPVGLFAVFYAGLRGASTRVIDRLDRLGGQCGNIYPEKIIFDVAGIPAIPGAKLVEALARQMEQFDPQVVLGEEVQDLQNLETVRRWGVSVTGNSIPVDPRMQTNIPGIFSAGDIVVHPSKMKLIATGAGEAAIAANAAADEIVPSRRCLYSVAGDRYLGKRLSDVASRLGREVSPRTPPPPRPSCPGTGPRGPAGRSG